MTAGLPIGVVGVGALGIHHARHLAAFPDVDFVGFYDIDPVRSAEVSAEVGVPAFSSLESLLRRTRAVTVAVPTTAHAEVGLAALERGVAVLVEKPFASTLEEADALVATATRAGVQLQVGHIERFNPALRAAEPYLDGPTFIEGQRLAPFQLRGTDVPVVLDLMIHDLDLILHLTGGVEATDVRAVGAAVLSPHLDLVHARVDFAGGVIASVTASRIARERVRRLRIYQPNGYLSLDLAAGRGHFLHLREGWQTEVASRMEDVIERVSLVAPTADALRLELQSFVHAVCGDRETVVTGAEGRAALRLALQVTEAVERSPLGVPAGG